MNKILTILTLIGLSFNSTAQVAQYNFTNNIDDQANNHDAIYLIDGVASEISPNYTTTAGTINVSLNSTEGLKLPASLPTSIDTNQSLEIEFKFTMTDLGSGNGVKHLWSGSQGANESGFYLFIRHDQLYNAADEYEIIFSYADGGFNLGIPDHPGHAETNIGKHIVGDVINLRLILNFKNRSWTSNVNGKYISKNFDPYYNWEILMESIKNNPWFFGWFKNQSLEMEYDPNNYTSSLSLNTLAFYSPRKSGNTTTVISALTAMTNHANGTNVISEEERANHLNELYINYFNNHNEVTNEVFAFINAYENNYPPVYSDRNVVSITSLLAESQLIIFLQQAIFDNEYTLTNVKALEGIKYEFADIFPGTVNDNAVRINNATATINGNHTYNPAARVVADKQDAKRPIGYYAAPGEIITIEIPAHTLNAGLSVLIGAHTPDHSTLDATNRFNRISKVYPLSSLSTEVVSPFGGGIYILIPLNSQLNWFDITISGAVKSPYFSWRSGRKTNPIDWVKALANHPVEWVDLESDNYMVTLPLKHIQQNNITDPTLLMTQWDKIITGFDYVGGRIAGVRKRSEYFIIDSRLPGTAFGTGYPQVIGERSAPYGPFSQSNYYPTQILNTNFWDSDISTTLHEMGHGALHPTLVDEVETIVHLPAVYAYNQYYALSMNDAFKYSFSESLNLNEAAMDWMIAFNFRNNNDMGCDPTMDALVCHELRYQHRGYAKYIVMANLFGWESVHNMNKVFFNKWTESDPGKYVVTKDEILKAASESNNLNMAPLFHFWGLAPSPSLKTELEALPSSPKILTQLIEYHNSIPNSQKDFQSLKQTLLNRKDPVHHGRINKAYDSYDSENYATQIKSQICNIIGMYYPNNNFCGALSSENNLLDDQFITVFPNPTAGKFMIDFKTKQKNISIKLLTVLGQVLESFDTLNTNRIEIDIKQPSGFYLVEIMNDQRQKFTFKVIKN